MTLLTDEERRPASRFLRKHMGSGVYVCGSAVPSSTPVTTLGPPDLPLPQAHLGRAAVPIDERVEAVVLGVLGETDIAKRLARGRRRMDA